MCRGVVQLGEAEAFVRIAYLKEFETLARMLSFTRAARRLNVSTSALSKHIAALERVVGQPLLARGEGYVELTAAGRRFYEGVSPILQEYDALMAGFGRGSATERRRLTVHVGVRTPCMMERLAATCARLLQEDGIEVTCPVPAFGVKYRTNLNEADAIIIYATGKVPDGCTVVPLGRDPFVAVMPRDHRLAGRECLSIRRDLPQTRIVRLKNDNFRSGQDAIFEAIGRCGVQPVCSYSLAASFDDVSLLCGMEDLLIMPSEALPKLPLSALGAQGAPYAVVPFEDEEACFEAALVYYAHKETRALRAFADALRSSASER